VLVLIALAMIGLLAVVAMAVDGSMVYADRRDLQSAADNAAMSAAGAAAISMDNDAINYQTFLCSSSDPDDIEEVAAIQAAEIAAINAAISRTGTYGYPIDTDISDHNGVQITCRIVVVAGLVERYLDIRVEIVHQSETGFTRFFLPNGVSNTVEAVARVQPRRSLSRGNAIASLGPDCPGIEMTGTGDIFVTGGGIFSNSCLIFKGSTDININVVLGGIGYVTTYTETNNVDIFPVDLTAEQSTEKLPIVEIPTPDCLSLTDYGVKDVNGTETIDPGRYTSINLGGSDHLIMNPGLYCFYGSFTTQGGQTVEVNPASPNEQGVTIYMAAGDVSFNGNSTIILRAPSVNQSPAIKGMLIYMPPTNAGAVTLTGTSGSSFRGTVYAPTGAIDVGGTADIPFATELVGYSVKVHGTAKIDVTDDAQFNFTRAPLIELVK